MIGSFVDRVDGSSFVGWPTGHEWIWQHQFLSLSLTISVLPSNTSDARGAASYAMA